MFKRGEQFFDEQVVWYLAVWKDDLIFARRDEQVDDSTT